MIGSRNIVENNYAGKTGAGVNPYRFNFLPDQGRKPIIIESVEKEHFSEHGTGLNKKLIEFFISTVFPHGVGIS